MAKLILDPLGFWLSLLESPTESAWGQLGQAWRHGSTTLCVSPGLVAMYMGPIQGPDAEALAIDEHLLGKIGWLLRQRAEWFQPVPGESLVGEPWDRLAWLAEAAKPDAIVVADPALTDWPGPLAAPVLTEPPATALRRP